MADPIHKKRSIKENENKKFNDNCPPCLKKQGMKTCQGCGQILYNTSPPCNVYFDCPQIKKQS